eukprot:TRINITY_DN381_c0_g1_i1.p1 TRINITY_DN381_c0_g1~~TRINITY_DN381_c0_g1_i1.p1  ORF type:complete len:679 (+),score=130.05 TRINITY_DN381_c0_g1_i1:82-2118(+)
MMDTKGNQNLTPIKNRLLAPSKLRDSTKEPQLSDFKEIKILGKGGFGVVSLGQHLKTKKFYALKKMTKSRLTKTVLKAIQSEIEIMMPLDHENIIKLYDYFEDDNSVVLILEYADGQQLYEKLSATQQQRFDEQSTWSYVKQLLLAIAYLHNQQPAILHRDIKPENLMLNKEKKIKLVDFGWSNYFEQDQIMRKTVCGTAAYLSPEMILGTGNDKMHDMWCIGVLIYEFLTGRDPFSPDPSQFTSQRAFEKKLYQNILHKAPSFPKNFPPLARDIVEKLLQKKTKDRLDVNQVLQHQWITQEFTESSLSQLSSAQEKQDANTSASSTQSSLKSQQQQQQSQNKQESQQQQSQGKNQEQTEKIQKLKQENNELQAKFSKIGQESIEKDHEIMILKAQKQELQKSLDQSQNFIIQLESKLEMEKKSWQNQVQLLQKGLQDNTELKSIQKQLDSKELELMNLKMTSSEQINKLTAKLTHNKQKKHEFAEKFNSLKASDKQIAEQSGDYQTQEDIVRKSITMRQSLSGKLNDKLCPEDGALLRELTKILVDLTIQVQNYSEKVQEISESKVNAFKESIKSNEVQVQQQDTSVLELKDQQELVGKVNELLKVRKEEDLKINQSIQEVQTILKQKKEERVDAEVKRELKVAKAFVEELKKEVEILKNTNQQLKQTIKQLENAQQ